MVNYEKFKIKHHLNEGERDCEATNLIPTTLSVNNKRPLHISII